MKILLLFISLLFTATGRAQTPYTSINDGSSTILNGIITKYAIINNSGVFPWYASNQKFTPDTALVSAMHRAKQDVHFILFGGTWCDDTQNILPKFFSVQEQAGFPDSRITFFGVDRSKKTIGGITDALGITNVPTIIVMRNGKEAGRVVEYGKSGKWESELADILK